MSNKYTFPLEKNVIFEGKTRLHIRVFKRGRILYYIHSVFYDGKKNKYRAENFVN